MGGTTVEHWIPRSEDASKKGSYENCLYACRFCNRSRSALPTRRRGARLLDPTRDAWAEHFGLEEDRLEAFRGDADAAYTHELYELDDPRKTIRRRLRRELITDRLTLLARLETEVTGLLGAASILLRRDPSKLGEILEEIREIRASARRALQDLSRYAAIPTDAPRTCRCPSPPAFALPDELEPQTIEIPDSIF